MNGGLNRRQILGTQHDAALFCHPEACSKQRLRRRRAKADHELWMHHFQLRVKPRAAGFNLALARLLVQTALPTRLPLEMLHHVRDVDTASLDSRFFQRAIEQLSCRSHKRMPFHVLPVAWLLANHHHAHRQSLGRPFHFAEHRLRRAPEQIASPASLHGLSQHRQRDLPRHKPRCTWHLFLCNTCHRTTPSSIGCSDCGRSDSVRHGGACAIRSESSTAGLKVRQYTGISIHQESGIWQEASTKSSSSAMWARTLKCAPPAAAPPWPASPSPPATDIRMGRATGRIAPNGTI